LLPECEIFLLILQGFKKFGLPSTSKVGLSTYQMESVSLKSRDF
jgi:hypothetical protein